MASLFLSAVGAGDALEVHRLLVEGVDVNCVSAAGLNAAHVAASKGANGLLSHLIAAGLHVDAADPSGLTPLHVATRVNNFPAVKALLDAGANPNLGESSLGFTALHYAARMGHTAVARALVMAGADIHSRDKLGNNPSFWALENCHDAFLQIPGVPPAASASVEERCGMLLLMKTQSSAVAARAKEGKKKTTKGAAKKGAKKKGTKKRRK